MRRTTVDAAAPLRRNARASALLENRLTTSEGRGTMTVLARIDRLPWSSHQRRVVGTLALSFAFELADINTFAYAAPAVRHYLGVSVREVSFITSAGFVGMFLGAAFRGRPAERLG